MNIVNIWLTWKYISAFETQANIFLVNFDKRVIIYHY